MCFLNEDSGLSKDFEYSNNVTIASRQRVENFTDIHDIDNIKQRHDKMYKMLANCIELHCHIIRYI